MGTVSDTRRENLLLLLQSKANGIKAEFSKLTGINANYISQLVLGNREMGDKTARTIEKSFFLPHGKMDLPNLGAFEPGPTVERSKGVPIVGRAMLGQDGYFVEEEYPPGHGDGSIPHPTNDPDAYSLRVVGESMAPAILSGWLIVVEPSAAPVVGEYAHVLTKNGQHMIKKLLSLKRESVSVISVNGGAIQTFAMEQLEYVRYVGGIYPPSKRRL